MGTGMQGIEVKITKSLDELIKEQKKKAVTKKPLKKLGGVKPMLVKGKVSAEADKQRIPVAIALPPFCTPPRQPCWLTHTYIYCAAPLAGQNPHSSQRQAAG